MTGIFGGSVNINRPTKERFARRNVLDGLAPAGSDRIMPPYAPATISTYQPSWRERVADMAGNLAAQQFGAGNYARQDVEKKVGDILDWLPFAGTAVNGNETYRAVKRGDWAETGLGVLGMAGSLVPIARPIFKEARAGGRRILAGFARNFARSGAEKATQSLVGRGVPVAVPPAIKSAGEAVAPARDATRYSRVTQLYDPPEMPPRPFEADYPVAPVADATGKLKFDMDGRPLIAKHVIGRRTVGGPDEPIDANGLVDLADQLTPDGIILRPSMEQWGVTRLDSKTGAPLRIELDASAPRREIPAILGHEDGHLVDDLAGQIPTSGLERELKDLFGTNNTAPDVHDLTTPETFNYTGDAVPREYMAEAIRANLFNPNTMKTLWPETAARIRAHVNAHPNLKNIIQFNSLLGGSIGVSAAARKEPSRR